MGQTAAEAVWSSSAFQAAEDLLHKGHAAVWQTAKLERRVANC